MGSLYRIFLQELPYLSGHPNIPVRVWLYWQGPPLERPKPGVALGGNVLKLAEARAMSNKDLRNWVCVNCPSYLVAELPKVRTITDMRDMKQNVLNQIEDILGRLSRWRCINMRFALILITVESTSFEALWVAGPLLICTV